MAETRFDPVAHAKVDARGRVLDRQELRRISAAMDRDSPDKLALLAYRSDRAERRRFTYAELGDIVSRAAASLKRLGIGAATSSPCNCRTGGNSRCSRSPRSASAPSSIR